ncbi:hypothetical protein LY78DRAFT_660215 [Colletotrichum sublineola]|nr:hypothetical protein LY78DRAFT_660215 [Colletotrichum sublineola]
MCSRSLSHVFLSASLGTAAAFMVVDRKAKPGRSLQMVIVMNGARSMDCYSS